MVHTLVAAKGRVPNEHELEEQGGPKRPRVDDDSDEDDVDLFSSDNEEESKKMPADGRNEVVDEQSRAVNVGQAQHASTETSDTDSLHVLIYKKEWNRVIERVRELRQKSNGETNIPELLATPDSFPFTPLQLACQYIQKDPDDVTDHKQWAECVRTILDGAPEAVLEKTSDEEYNEMSVFHLILQQQPPLELFEYMVRVYSEQKGIDIEKAWNEIARQRDGNPMKKGKCCGPLPIHYAVQEHASSNLVLKLLEEYPDSAVKTVETADKNVLSTIDMAVFYGCSKAVLVALLKLGTGAISNNKGPRGKLKNTPLHLLFHLKNQKRWIRDDGQGPSDDIMSSYKMAEYLILKHALHFNEDLGAKGNKSRADPKTRARELIRTTGEGKYTISERAKQLEEAIEKLQNVHRRDYPELTRILEYFDGIKSGVIDFRADDLNAYEQQ